MNVVNRVTSSDGTSIGLERSGAGPALILVDAAGSYRDFRPLRAPVELLAADFTVVTYDRRGRGASTDTQPYAVEREVDDLAALIADAGGSAFVYAVSSGSLLALHAAAIGHPAGRWPHRTIAASRPRRGRAGHRLLARPSHDGRPPPRGHNTRIPAASGLSTGTRRLRRPSEHPVAAPTVVAGIALSWLGLVIHNLAELTGQARLGPQTVAPTAVSLLLAAGWLSPGRRVAAWLLLGWGWLHAIGGGLLSVLSVPWWPYRPEQSLRHYAVHALYGVLQVPLLIVLTRYLRRLRAAGEVTAR